MSSEASTHSDFLPEPMVVPCSESALDTLLDTEWLLTNRIGAYASSSVIGCNTRRYHGLLVAATEPPVGRMVALAMVMEELIVGEDTYLLSINEFPGAFSPRGVQHLVEFRNDVCATFVFRFPTSDSPQSDGIELTKRIILAERTNAVAIQYTLTGADASLSVRPFAALRDFHHLRLATLSPQITFEAVTGGAIVQDRSEAGHCLHLLSQEATFQGEPQ